jgi:hypothetical protein
VCLAVDRHLRCAVQNLHQGIARCGMGAEPFKFVLTVVKNEEKKYRWEKR